jgi:hypothetical protein
MKLVIELNSTGSGYGQIAACFEHAMKLMISLKAEKYQLF